MKSEIIKSVCWLVFRATKIKDPYDFFYKLRFQSHPLGLPAPELDNYHSSLRTFAFIGDLDLKFENIADFEDQLVRHIMINGYSQEKNVRFIRKISVKQPPGSKFSPMVFYEANIDYTLFLVGGRAKNKDDVRSLDELFNCLKWIYELEIRELEIEFAQIKGHYLALQKKIREYRMVE